MKKYFTKYLPVEGEITEGDKILIKSPVSSISIETVEKIIRNDHGRAAFTKESGDNYLDLQFEGKFYFKVKLFLCSRDIQIGDKIQTVDGKVGYVKDYESISPVKEYMCVEREENIEGYPEGDHDFTFANPCYSARPYGFKVIGEVSPAAIWVTEGMEFNEEDIYFVGGFHGVIPHNLSDFTNPVVEIRCQTCKTFH